MVILLSLQLIKLKQLDLTYLLVEMLVLTWGLRFGYESNENGDDNESSGMDLGLSGTVAGANVWLNYVMAVTTKKMGLKQSKTQI